MRRILLAAAVLCIASPARAHWLLDFDEGEVLKVTSGDTLKLRVTVIRLFPGGDVRRVSDETVRLPGIDCPASREVKKCGTWRKHLTCKDEMKLGKRVAAYVKQLLPEGTKVKLRQRGTDREGRTLGYIELPSGDDLGLKLLETGQCKLWRDKRSHQLQYMYERARPTAK